MPTISPRIFAFQLVALLSLFLAGTRPLSAGEPTSRSYKLMVQSSMKMNAQGRELETTAQTEYFYTWQQKDNTRTLILNAVKLSVIHEGTQVQNSVMNRERFNGENNGEPVNYSFDQAPAEIQTILKDSFATPLLTLEVDAQGKELSRKVTAGKGAEALLHNGLLTYCLFFHPPNPPEAPEWKNASEMNVGGGNLAKGDLTYKRIDENPNAYGVSGILLNEKFAKPGNPVVIKNTRYVGVGEQLFDPEKKAWAGGNFKFNFVFELYKGETLTGQARGLLGMILETREKPAKSK